MKLNAEQNNTYSTGEHTPMPARVRALAEYGLTREQAAQRMAAGLNNKSVESPTKTVPQIIAGNTFTYFNLIFFVLAAALLAVGSFQNLLFLIVVVVNTLIGIIQELNAKKTLDRLVLLSAPKAAAVRDGEVVILPTDKTVLDDIVIFKTGNQIYADGSVLDGEITVNESLITGESDDITKRTGDKLVSGSFVVSGECRARLEKVGADSFVSGLTLEAKKNKKHKQTGMMKALTRLLQIIGIAIIPVGILLYRQQTNILHLTTKAGIENTTAALIGMIPEGLYLLVSVALAVSVVRLSKKKTLVHDLKCIETLARVDVLCVDKTGTITENSMEVTAVEPLETTDLSLDSIEILLTDFVKDMAADNSTMQALKEHFTGASPRRAEKIKAFSSTTKYSAVSFGPGENYALGAPEFVLRSQYANFRETIESFTAKGSRVLVLAKCGSLDGNAALETVTPIALVMLDNPIRPTAKSTFEYFLDQGVEIKVISGDNQKTVAVAAEKAGIANAGSCVDASTLDTNEKLIHAAGAYTVFGRVTPVQKRQLVYALQKAGHTVAMTGDGVNDVLALKAADCSIAMASGSEVASQVSHLVMLGSDFDSMPLVVAEGRRVINNIERSAALFLVKNIFSFILAVISISAVFAYPLTPSQLSLISMITIGIPSFILSLEPNTNLVRGNFLINVIYRALPAALTDLVIVIGVVLFDAAFNLDSGELSTITAFLVTAVGFIMIWRVCRPLNWKDFALLGGLAVIFAGVLLFAPWLFTLSHLSFGSVLVLAVFLLLIPSVMWLFTLCLDKIAAFCRFCAGKIQLLKEDSRKQPKSGKAAKEKTP